MNIKEAEKYNELGIIDGVDAVFVPHFDAWILEIILDNSVPEHQRLDFLHSSSGRIKRFKSLDTMFKDADRIRGHSITRIALDEACPTLPEQMDVDYDS